MYEIPGDCWLLVIKCEQRIFLGYQRIGASCVKVERKRREREKDTKGKEEEKKRKRRR